MRTSTYEIVLPLIGADGGEIKGKALLVNGLCGAFDVVKKEEAEKVAAGDLAGLSPALRERLLLRGHLTEKSEAEEIADLKMLGRIYRLLPARSGVGLVIMPTYDCNFRCPYCYESHRLKNGQEWLSCTMSQEMIGAVFAALEKYKEKGYTLGECTLYGGEPFLARNIDVVREIAGHSKALGLALGAVTNGYDLENYLDLLEEFNFKSLQLTVDGVGAVNDRRRIHKDGVPTYDRILQNAKLALGRGISISLRVNVGRENISDIGALVEDLRGRGFMETDGSAVFSYYFKATDDDRNPENNVSEQDIIDELMKNGFSALEAIELNSAYSAPADALRQLFQKKIMPMVSTAYCGAEQGALVVDPFGRIYPCWDTVAVEDAAVGFTDSQSGRFLMNFAKAKWRTRTADLMPSCEACPYVFVCRGGCAARAFVEHGSYFRESCGKIKDIFAFVAPRIAGEAWAKGKEDELSLSLAEPLSHLTEAERQTLMESRSQKEILEIVKSAGYMNKGM